MSAGTRSFLSYWLNAIDDHSLQAPFIYEFYQEVIKCKSSNPTMREVKTLRKSLVRDHRLIKVTDFGTGNNRSDTRSISAMARSSNRPKVSQMLFNICRKYQPRVILELGTNLGLSTLSMAAGAPKAKILSIEGCTEISQQASEHFSALKVTNIELLTGNIEKVLPQVLPKLDSIDLLFMDANHRYRPTLDYFTRCLTWFSPQSIVVIDDIHHSQEMEMAWNEIKQWPQAKLTADLFHAGLVFFTPYLNKTHYVLQF